MIYQYLYQDSQNQTHQGEVKARDREDAYVRLRKQGIRPYRIIGDDPWNWRPWAVAVGYVLLLAIVVGLLMQQANTKAPVIEQVIQLSAEEAETFRIKAEEAVYRAPEAFRYNVWKGVNARLAERGLSPLDLPEGLTEE